MPGITRDESPGGFGINGVIPGDGKCVVAGCKAPCPLDALMCRPHWRSVPHGLQDNMRYAMSLWRGGEGTLEDVRIAQWACVDALEGGA